MLAGESTLLEAILPYAVLGIVIITAAAVLYLYRLEKIPGLGFNQALAVLLICRILDAASFWLVSSTTGTGGEIAQAELNLVYWFLMHYFSPAVSFALSLVPSVLGPMVFFYFYYRILLWGATVSEARRFALTGVAAFSVLSLLGVATNIAFALFGWNSPFLI